MLEEKFFCILLGFFLIIVLLRWPCFEKFNNYINLSSLSNRTCEKSCGNCNRSNSQKIGMVRINKQIYK